MNQTIFGWSFDMYPSSKHVPAQEDETEDSEDDDAHNDKCQHGPVRDLADDDTLFEGFYERGTPHGYFRHINSYGDLEFFGCFHRGTMLGK